MKIIYILLILLIPFTTVLAGTKSEKNFNNLIQAYNNAGQHYLYELQSGVQSSETNWHDQFQFYESKISEALDSYVTSLQEHPTLCKEAINVFQKYISNFSSNQNVSNKIREEEAKINRDYSMAGLGNIMSATNNQLNRFNQFSAMKNYCKQIDDAKRQEIFKPQ